jgi:hypothetical protein
MYPCDLTGHEFVTSKINPDEEICVHCFMTRLNPFTEVIKAAFEFKKVRDFEELHVTYDFKMRLFAHPDAPQFINFYELRADKEKILGVPLITHKTAEKQFWFEPSEIATRYEDFNGEGFPPFLGKSGGKKTFSLNS